MNSFSALMQSALQFFSEDPSIFVAQISMVALAFIVVFLVLLATRDIMMRTDSLFIQILCIILVAGLPLLGYFIYLLVRPSRTLLEKRLQGDLEDILKRLSSSQNPKKQQVSEKGKKTS